jgi:exopolysaccharide biosynthesis polyprenyl glycosylphosphotransferase
MNLTSKKESILYALGDILVLYISLWVMLLIRYFEFPSLEAWQIHFLPFTLLFVLWFGIFFIFGLYEKQILIRRTKILPTILQVQIVNSIIAVLFFYFVPVTQIAPKTNLFIYLIVSVILLGMWRVISMSRESKKQIPICLVARGEDAHFLKRDLQIHPSGFEVTYFLDLDNSLVDVEGLIEHVYMNQIKYIILDTKDDAIVPYLPNFYNLMFSGIQFFEVSDMYEALYNRVPLQLVKHGWFLEHIKSKPHILYDFFKRVMDISVSVVLLLLSFIFYPFVYLALKLEDGKEIFSIQERIGKNNQIIKMLKFRTMTFANDGGKWKEEGQQNKVTKVGAFLRKTRIDELPQLWNVLMGDISLIGPRPEFMDAVNKYVQQIPYYNVRHLITPGLSGWAQIYHDNHPHHGVDFEATKEKLSYDLFYIKNRSLMVDLLIGLKTIKTLLLSKGK